MIDKYACDLILLCTAGWKLPGTLVMCENQKHAANEIKRRYDQPRQHIIKQRHYFVNKCLPSQGYGFPSSHVWV